MTDAVHTAEMPTAHAPTTPNADHRVLLLAPTLRDAAASCSILKTAQIECELCRDMASLCREISGGVAAIVVPEEDLVGDSAEALARELRQQPVWSDIPVVVLSRSGVDTAGVEKALRTMGNVSVIERPVRILTLMSMVKTALRARQRQYQIRDYLIAQKQSERQLREARDAAEAANRAKDQFLAVLSHELRTPLSPVVMAIAAMEADPKLPQAFSEDVTMIRRNVELEARLIDDLLDLSRITTGKLQLQTKPTSVHQLLKYVVEVCGSDLNAKRQRIRIHLDAANDRVLADPARLQQVLWNLLKNAIKFTPVNGEIVVRSSQPARNRFQLEIRDTGVGIEPDVLPRIFDAFEQGDPKVTRQFGGLGLGLAISKAVADLHGGALHARSAGRDRGATFTLELPSYTLPKSPEHAAAAAPPPDAEPHRRVLLVEDHPDTARTLTRLLKLMDFDVRTANDARTALALAEKEPFEIIVSDIGLPDKSGYELMKQMRELYNLRGIALSGYGMEEDMRRSREAGFCEHVVKPVNVGQLTAIMRRVLDSPE